MVKKQLHMAWSYCCETPSQVRDGIKKNILLNKNSHLSSPLLLPEFEKSSLLRWLWSKDLLMQPAWLCSFFFALLSSKPPLSKNKSKLCSPSVNTTYNYRSMWEHKGINNNFQAEMRDTSFKLKDGKRNSIWDTNRSLCFYEKTFNLVQILMISIAFNLIFICGNVTLCLLLYLVKWEVISLLRGFKRN